MTTTEILAMIGGITLVLTAAARIPAALAEFLQACILVTITARELRAALTGHAPPTTSRTPGTPARHVHRTPYVSPGAFTGSSGSTACHERRMAP